MKVAVVTGVVSDYGVPIINNLLSEDYVVFVLTLESRYIGGMSLLADNQDLYFITGSVSGVTAWENLFQTIVDTCHDIDETARVDLLINLMNVDKGSNLHNTSTYELDFTLQQTLYPLFTGVKALLQLLQNTETARVINVYPDCTTKPTDDIANTISKISTDAMTQCLAKDLASYGIYVNSICYPFGNCNKDHVIRTVNAVRKSLKFDDNGVILVLDSDGLVIPQSSHLLEVLNR